MNIPRKPRNVAGRARQRGQAFFMAVMLLVAGIAAVIYSFASPAKITIENEGITAAALARAKEALIGYAASHSSQPGILPCPDSDNDGSADAPCGALGLTAIGRLPWRTLGLPDLRDGAGECLWYAVSANFKNSGGSGPSSVNSDSPGTLAVYDSNGTLVFPPSTVVAVVFAPGAMLSGQDRSPSSTAVCGGNSNAANYLDTYTVGATTFNNATGSGTNSFISAPPLVPLNQLNDKLLAVTRDALFTVVDKRVAKEVLNALNSYFAANGTYPPQAISSDPTCLGNGPLPDIDCPSDPALPTSYTPGRIPNLPLLVPYGAGSAILRGDITTLVSCPNSTYWFQCNGWRELTWMAASPLCTSVPGCATGDLIVWKPSITTGYATSNRKIVVFVAGRALAGDARSIVADKTTSSNYLEPENVAGPNYNKGPVISTFNDQTFHN